MIQRAPARTGGRTASEKPMSEPIRLVSSTMRVDQALIAGMIAAGSRVLDIGCGDGSLIGYLVRTKGCDARGIEIDMNEVTEAIINGCSVVHGDADTDLTDYPDDSFDYVVLSRTLQAVEKPRAVLAQMLRIGAHAVVSFPNFGHWAVRWRLLRTGRMPVTTMWDRPWHETPNIHPCTIRDFFVLCAEEGYVVENWLAADDAGGRSPWRRFPRLANLFGEQGVFLLRKRRPDEPEPEKRGP
jgi:methionine biosynthesis protein MetW